MTKLLIARFVHEVTQPFFYIPSFCVAFHYYIGTFLFSKGRDTHRGTLDFGINLGPMFIDFEFFSHTNSTACKHGHSPNSTLI